MLQAPDVQTYIRDLRLNYPPDVALVLLNSLGTTGMQLDDTLAPGAHVPAYDDDATVTLGETTEPLKVFADPRDSDTPETAAIPKSLLEQNTRPTTPSQQGPTMRSRATCPDRNRSPRQKRKRRRDRNILPSRRHITRPRKLSDLVAVGSPCAFCSRVADGLEPGRVYCRSSVFALTTWQPASLRR